MPIDSYHGLEVYPWSLATTDNEITKRRVETIAAVVEQICAMPWWHRRKIKAVTLLGELHHLFPNFEAGMGFAPPYIVSDYSATSTKDFRALLLDRFRDHRSVESASWLSIPVVFRHRPAKQGHSQRADEALLGTHRLLRSWSAADQWLGAYAPGHSTPTWIRIYLNGEQIGPRCRRTRPSGCAVGAPGIRHRRCRLAIQPAVRCAALRSAPDRHIGGERRRRIGKTSAPASSPMSTARKPCAVNARCGAT